jgi:hypothetical protein
MRIALFSGVGWLGSITHGVLFGLESKQLQVDVLEVQKGCSGETPSVLPCSTAFQLLRSRV